MEQGPVHSMHGAGRARQVPRPPGATHIPRPTPPPPPTPPLTCPSLHSCAHCASASEGASMTGTPMRCSRRLHSSLCSRVTRTVRLLYFSTSSSLPACAAPGPWWGRGGGGVGCGRREGGVRDKTDAQEARRGGGQPVEPSPPPPGRRPQQACPARTSLAASSSAPASSRLLLRFLSSALFSSGGLPSNTKLQGGAGGRGRGVGEAEESSRRGAARQPAPGTWPAREGQRAAEQAAAASEPAAGTQARRQAHSHRLHACLQHAGRAEEHALQVAAAGQGRAGQGGGVRAASRPAAAHMQWRGGGQAGTLRGTLRSCAAGPGAGLPAASSPRTQPGHITCLAGQQTVPLPPHHHLHGTAAGATAAAQRHGLRWGPLLGHRSKRARVAAGNASPASAAALPICRCRCR